MESLVACGNRTRIETCNLTEIEGAELEADFADFDAERGEVEMACGDELVDVTWSQFQTRLQVDPGQYQNNLEALKRQVTCVKDEHSRNKEVFCNSPGAANEFVALSFSYDD